MIVCPAYAFRLTVSVLQSPVAEGVNVVFNAPLVARPVPYFRYTGLP